MLCLCEKECVKKTQREEIKNEWVTDYETTFPFPAPQASV